MPRHDSQLQEFLLTALAVGTYLNLVWSDRDRGIFTLRLVRKRRRDGRQESPNFGEFNNIFQDWDQRKGHVYDPSRSKNRLLVSMKNSSYLNMISVSSYSVTYQFCTAQETNERKRQKKERAEAMKLKQLDIMDRVNLFGPMEKADEVTPLLRDPKNADECDSWSPLLSDLENADECDSWSPLLSPLLSHPENADECDSWSPLLSPLLSHYTDLDADLETYANLEGLL